MSNYAKHIFNEDDIVNMIKSLIDNILVELEMMILNELWEFQLLQIVLLRLLTHFFL